MQNDMLNILIDNSVKTNRYLDIIEFLLNNVQNKEEILSKIYKKYKIYFILKDNKIFFIGDKNEK